MSIQTEVTRREITQLLHFTNVTNLPKILVHGIVPRNDLTDGSYEFNDNLRIDGHLNASCVSISHPNSGLFYRFRQNSPNTKWAIISINPRVLWEKSCSFYPRNAASNEVRFTPPTELSDEASFTAMFADEVGQISRLGQNLTLKYTTDLQAEVLVFDTIETRFFERIFYSEKSIAETYYPYNTTLTHSYYPNIDGKHLYAGRDYFLR